MIRVQVSVHFFDGDGRLIWRYKDCDIGKIEMFTKDEIDKLDATIKDAAYEGTFPLGDRQIDCAVLPNGKRIISQATFLRALGRSRSPKAGTGVLSTVDGIPFFLQANALKPYLSDEVLMSTTPIFYRTKGGGRGVGFFERFSFRTWDGLHKSENAFNIEAVMILNAFGGLKRKGGDNLSPCFLKPLISLSHFLYIAIGVCSLDQDHERANKGGGR